VSTPHEDLEFALGPTKPSELEKELGAIVRRSAPSWQVMWSKVDGGYVRCEVDLLGHHVQAESRSKKKALSYALMQLAALVAAGPEES
jgi:hypothetical protein